MTDDVESFLHSLPLGKPVTVEGEPVFLRVGENGTELGVILFTAPTDAQLIDVSRIGFQSALEYDAGLGIWAEEDAVVLSRWLPSVTSWPEAAEPLEELLEQAALWRSALAPSAPKATSPELSANERRIRAMIAGKM
jgi:hypothetical protein